jgi:two-component system NarL family response regulator
MNNRGGGEMSISVVIIEKQRMLRELLVAVLRREPDIRVVGEGSSGAQAISLTRQWRPHVLLLNYALPDMNGIQVVRVLQTEAAAVRLIALSNRTQSSVVQGMLHAGAMGYVVKSAAAVEVVQAIRIVSAGGRYLSPALGPKGYGNENGPQNFGPPISVLGRREREVLALLAEGRHSREIAEKLDISTATVEVHRRNIMHKLGLHNVAQLTKYAIKNGLTSL